MADTASKAIVSREDRPKVECPHCGGWHSRVLPKYTVHPTEAGFPRLRECLSCHQAFRTREIVILLEVPKNRKM